MKVTESKGQLWLTYISTFHDILVLLPVFFYPYGMSGSAGYDSWFISKDRLKMSATTFQYERTDIKEM